MFADFWNQYPIKRDKVKAQKAFAKLSPPDQQAAIAGVKREIAYREQMAKAGEWCPAWSYAQGWLNGRRWEDELTMPETSAKPVNGNAAWEKLCSRLGVVPATEYPEFDDRLISKALFRVGSWMEFARMPEKQQKFEFRPKFLEAYRELGG